MSDYENSTHFALYKTSKHRVRLLVHKNDEGWHYQLYDMNVRTGGQNYPVSDWISGRTFAKQALEQYIAETVEPLTWNLRPSGDE